MNKISCFWRLFFYRAPKSVFYKNQVKTRARRGPDVIPGNLWLSDASKSSGWLTVSLEVLANNLFRAANYSRPTNAYFIV